MEGLGISDWDRFQRIIEFDRTDFETPAEKSDNFMIIELTFIASIIIVGKSIRNVQLMDLQLLMMNTLMDLS